MGHDLGYFVLENLFPSCAVRDPGIRGGSSFSYEHLSQDHHRHVPCFGYFGGPGKMAAPKYPKSWPK